MNLKDLEQDFKVRSYWDIRDQLKRHIYGRSLKAFAKGDIARDKIQSKSDMVTRQNAIRKNLLSGIGGLPSSNTPLNAQTVGVVQGKGFRIEKIIFESRPKTFVTANLYVPNGISQPRGAVLFLCGHDKQAKHSPEYQTVCQILVQSGLIVFAQDPIGQGERLSYTEKEAVRHGIRWGTMEHDYVGTQCLPLGDGLARYFLHDGMRGLDYLCSRPEVDSKKIGVTGNSGGGTQTSLMMLTDRRIVAAAPATFIMNRECYIWTGQAQDAEQIWPGFTLAGFDHEDILLSVCPKPVRVLSVKSDFFPIEGTRRTVERCRRLWKLAGKPALLDLVEDASTHKYTPRLAEAAAQFFTKHLLGKTVITKASVSLFPPPDLWCTKSGQVAGEISGARAVHQENCDRVAELRAGKKISSKVATAWLKKKILGPREKCDLNPRFMSPVKIGTLECTQAFWWSQPGLINHGLLFRSPTHRNKKLPVTLAIWNGGTSASSAHIGWIRRCCREGRAVVVLDVTGAGSLAPNSLNLNALEGFYGVLHKFSDDLLWLDDDLAALRSYDVIRALDVLQEWADLDSKRVALYAHGQHGVYAQLAAAIDPRAKKVEVTKGIGSYAAFVKSRYYDHRDIKSVVLRGILEYSDLPELSRTRKRK